VFISRERDIEALERSYASNRAEGNNYTGVLEMRRVGPDTPYVLLAQ
jgi:hypothetical protein